MNDPLAIAQREHYLADDPKRETVLKLEFMSPGEVQDGHPSCLVVLTTASGALHRKVSGADSADCFLLAFSVAGTTINGLNQSQYDGKLRWDGSDEEDATGILGLPTIEERFKASYEAAVAWGQQEAG